MNIKKTVLFLFCIFIIINVCSCDAQKSPQTIFKKDSYYFLGLRKLSEGNKKEAERLFKLGSDKSSMYCARKSAEEFLKIGNIRERVEKAEKFIKKYSDNDALLIAVKIFENAEEYNKIILYTNNINIQESNDALISIRLQSLLKKKDSHFELELTKWFTEKKISSEHYKFYNSNLYDYNEIINFRIEVYKRNYKKASEIYNNLEPSVEMSSLLFSDLGKTLLYSGADYYTSAIFFDKITKSLSDFDDSKFYTLFYAARLYEKTEKYTTLASNRYKEAMECATVLCDDEKYDNALWYLLNSDLRFSTDKAIEDLKKYCISWHDPKYFDDFLNLLPPILLSEGKWNVFYDLYQDLDGFATNESVAKFAYIYGRLIQEKIAIPFIGELNTSESDAAFTRALTSGSDVYYRVMAIYQLNLAGTHEEEVLNNTEINTEENIDLNAESLLLGYAAFGFPEKIYQEYINFYSKNIFISTKASFKIATFLNECGKDKPEYYPQSLRIVAKSMQKTNIPLSKADLELFFPRNYSEIIKKCCEEFNLPEENMYALIRSESFFDSKIESFAGAVGLSQLMNDTAADIARKLKISNFDLTDSELNIRFGAFYLEELYERLNKSWMPSFFAYNAGITRVRRWMKDSKISFDNKKDLPNDILLEVIPYPETREYGRKLVGATAMYSWLYYNKSITETVDLLIK